MCKLVCAWHTSLPPVVMYISCFVGPPCMWSPGSHQTFILQSHISISRDPAQPHGLGRVPVPLRPVIACSICVVSSSGSLLRPYPLFCSNPFVERLFVFSLMSITFSDYSHENKEPQTFQALNGPKPGCC